ncbi:MAG: hypothetical protein M3Q03_06290 [Chloroflexota bacterium]|nr:hypothetical protein [Chloroflexota bacterium]
MRRRSVAPSLAVVLALLFAGWIGGAGAGARQADPALALGGDPRVDAEDFRVTVFAEGLLFPFGMAELEDGSLLVGTSDPAGGGYFGGPSNLLRLVDEDGDGVADGAGMVLYGGLPGGITAMARAGELVFVTTGGSAPERISVLRVGEEPDEPLTLMGSIEFGFEEGQEHRTYAVAARERQGERGRIDLFFNVGSADNDGAGGSVAVSGLTEGVLEDASIYRVRIEEADGEPAFSEPEQIASGLRNAAGIAVHPASGDLLFEDNGIDLPGNRIESLGADELNLLPARAIGGEVEDFGFPGAYVEYRTGREVGGGGRQPLAAFQPQEGSESEGAVGVAVAPPGFPEGLNDGVFVGFHGQYDETGLANEENPLVYVDLETGESFQFVGNEEPQVGHLDSLLATDDALFAVDVTGPGSILGAEPLGVIYAIRAAEPERTEDG